MRSEAQSPTAEELMAAYVHGDASAFDTLYEMFSSRIFGYFLRTFSDTSVAADLFQTTFFKAHRARLSYRLGSPVTPWLFTIAERVRIDELRRRGRERARRQDIDPEVASAGVAPIDPSDRTLETAVRDAVRELPDGQRRVIELHKFEGLPLAHVAQVLGITEGAAKVRAHRAYGVLRELLRDKLTALDLDWSSPQVRSEKPKRAGGQ